MIDLKYLRKQGFKPAYFGLGFIQLKLSQDHKLHFYSTELEPILADEELHTHRYNFTSMVIKGVLYNELFTYKEPPETETSNFELVEVTCKPDNVEQPIVINSNVIPISIGTFFTKQYQSYSLKSASFHRVRWHENTVTLLRKDTPEIPTALVIRNKNHPFVCPYSYKLKESDCWKLMKKILD